MPFETYFNLILAEKLVKELAVLLEFHFIIMHFCL